MFRVCKNTTTTLGLGRACTHWLVCSTPHAFSPDALSPHTLSPCTLSPHTLSPCTLSPHTLRPDGLSENLLSSEKFWSKFTLLNESCLKHCFLIDSRKKIPPVMLNFSIYFLAH